VTVHDNLYLYSSVLIIQTLKPDVWRDEAVNKCDLRFVCCTVNIPF